MGGAAAGEGEAVVVAGGGCGWGMVVRVAGGCHVQIERRCGWLMERFL